MRCGNEWSVASIRSAKKIEGIFGQACDTRNSISNRIGLIKHSAWGRKVEFDIIEPISICFKGIHARADAHRAERAGGTLQGEGKLGGVKSWRTWIEIQV